jgi:transcriptional regulator with GAF, ATPase, and Fis domain
MQTCSAWFQACGCTPAKEVEVRAELAAAGVCLRRREDCRFGVVCFANADDALFSLLQSAAQQCCQVLAVAAGPAKEVVPAWRLLEAGAADTLTWSPGGETAEQVCVKLKRWLEIDDLVQTVFSDGTMVGESAVWRGLVRRIVEAAYFSAAPILLMGESGTGKEVLAKVVSRVTRAVSDAHTPRRDLVTLDCGTLAPELSGSEFFGHERGAFTGAYTAREGAFALADGATLFLDEIGDIPLSLQPQILRCIQEQTYKRLGSNVWQKSNFRLVSATNRDLKLLVDQGGFRLDLYYRVAGWVFQTPPLSGRRQDILPLVTHFLGRLLGRETPELDAHLRDYLINRDYPGNVRELHQLAQRITARYSASGPITLGDLPEEDRPAGGVFKRGWPNVEFEKSIAEAVMLGTHLKDISKAAAQAAIRTAVNLERGNIKRAAGRLGVTDRAIQLRRAAGQLKHEDIDEANDEGKDGIRSSGQNPKASSHSVISGAGSSDAGSHQGEASAMKTRQPAFATKTHSVGQDRIRART